MQSLVNSLIFVSVVIAAGTAWESASAQTWQAETPTTVPFPSALGQRAVPPPPEEPSAVTHPASWAGATAAPNFSPWGNGHGAQTPPQGPTPYPGVSQLAPDEADSRAVPWNNPLPAAPTSYQSAHGSAASYSATPAAGTDTVTPVRPPVRSGAAAEARLDTGPGVVAELQICEGAQPLATVGSDWILAGEILGTVNEILHANADRIPKAQLEEQRTMLIRQKLNQRIETKLIYQDARRGIPQENFPMVEEKLGEYFEKTELPSLMKRAGAVSRQDLEAKLQEFGTSVSREKRGFMERTLAQQWVQEQVKTNEEISHQQMLDYYQQRIADYEYPGQARWEQLMVRFSKYPDKKAAEAAIAEMGNQVFAGVPFADVAKARSDGPTASEGGQRDWTSKGSLASKVLDEALFGLPVGRLSRILEDEHGFHIIRILERKEAGRTPFLEAQVAIRDKIREQRRREKIEVYLARLKEEIPVWTVFDDSQTTDPMAGSLKRRQR